MEDPLSWAGAMVVASETLASTAEQDLEVND